MDMEVAVRSRLSTRSFAFLSALALAFACTVSPAAAAQISSVGPPDYVRGTVPVVVTGDATTTWLTVRVEHAGIPDDVSLVMRRATGSFEFKVPVPSDTTVTVRAYAGGGVSWSDTAVLKRAGLVPERPVLALRHNQVFEPGQDLAGTCASSTTTLTVEVKKGSRWSPVWSVGVPPGPDGAFALGGVKLPANRSDVRIVASNGFGSASSASQSVYSIGSVPNHSKLVLVDRSSRRLWVIRDGAVKYTYRCAVGMPWTPTPLGTFRLGKRHRTPNAVWGPWRLRMWRRVVSGGSTRYVSTSYFIHGTNRPSSIGQYASHGCIRLLNKNIRKLSTIIDGYKAVVRE